MASKIRVNLDTSKEYYKQEKCKQNDDLTLIANIFEDGAAKDLTNCSIVIQATKADNTYVIQNTEISKSNNKITAELARDFTRVPGESNIEVVLVEGGKQNTTFSFILEVDASVIKGAEESKDIITSLEKMQDAVVEMGKISEETKELINNSGAASKEEINKVNTQLAEKINKLEQYKDLEASRIYRDINNSIGGQGSFMQGGTYTKDNKVIYAIYDVITPNTNIVELVEVDISKGEKLRTKILNLGHCNSLTYDSKRNILISATLNKYINEEKTYVNELIEIDYETLSILKTVNLDTLENISGVAYEKEKNKVYVLLDPFIIAICDPATYIIEKRINLDVPKKITAFIRQSFEVWNNKIFLCGYANNYISVYDMEGKNIENYNVPSYMDNAYLTGELEDITSLGDGNFLMFSSQLVSTKFVINTVSKFNFVNRVASGIPYGFVKANDPMRIYVDINSSSTNPDGTETKPFKQLHEAILFVTSPLFSNVEIQLAKGVYDWTYIGQCNCKINISGPVEKAEIRGVFINGGDVILNNIIVNDTDNTIYKGLISTYNANVTVSNTDLNTKDYGIYANFNSNIKVRNLAELNNNEEVYTIYALASTSVVIQKSATNIVKVFVDNTCKLSPHLMIYNNTNGDYMNNIPIPKWFEPILEGNSLKFLEFSCGLKATSANPTYAIERVLLSGYTNITISLTRISGNITYISIINLGIVTQDSKKYFSPTTGYITTYDFSGGTPVITTKNMTAGQLGSIYISRIYATN
ncbi:MAG: BppU family phage baseplate upper protein [Clostridium sp.]|uniref:BppU family phage baseplate upper protein n=1 Tax=Clostridium sp. TaxID=1506 RepID=UPI002907B217|nr:BppU family phage baseplate upper protein [Clostridium sp.]MDU5109752.1 BppU family phage baseplate upper protein [Clostridium sp.]